MKRIFIPYILCAALMIGCAERNAHEGHNHDDHSHAHDQSCEEHDHAGHSHEGHDHAAEGHSHDGQPCTGHDHTGHSHDSHDHAAEGHDHAAETDAEHAGHDHGAGEAAHTNEIVFTREQAAGAIDFALETVQPALFHEVIPAGGQILPAQGDEAAVVASFSGIVRFSSKRITAGTSVGRGEALFHISSREIAEGDQTVRIEAAYRQAEAAWRRAESLIGDRIISQADHEAARLNYETARAAREALGRSSAQGATVVAPLGGFIKSVTVAEGQYVEVGQPLATVSQNRRLVLRAEVSMKYAARIGTLSGGSFITPYDARAHRLAELNGRLISAGKASDGNSAYLPVSFEFDNRGDLLPGSFVEVFLDGPPVADALTVPLSALVEEQGHYYLFVQIDPDCYRKQEVMPGARNATRMHILKGLHAGDAVVARGATLVRMASFSGAIPHGHTH